MTFSRFILRFFPHIAFFLFCTMRYFLSFYELSRTYKCVGEHGIRSQYATLTIFVAPDPPKILQGDFMVTTEDREIELECVSENGKPAAEVFIFTFSNLILKW